MSDKNSRIQLRGVCCICSKIHATKGGAMVHHGYTVEWGQFSGDCAGVHEVHYGHEKAPEVIAAYIVRLQDYLKTLPDSIAALNAILDKRNTELAALVAVGKLYSNKENRELRKTISQIEQELYALNRALDGGVESSIKYYELRAKKWVAVDLVAVDVEVEAAEIKKAKAKLAEEKRANKANELALKKAKAEKMKANSLNKKQELLESIKANNHYRLFHRGKLVKEWIAAASTENDIYDAFAAKYREHFNTLNIDDDAMYFAGEFLMEVRTKAEGKGKKIFEVGELTGAEYARVKWG